jgi:AbrB family looped-hinge helix DNA binding protein
MEQLIKVTRGGQVTIPAALRQAAGIEVGDYLEVQLVGDKVVLTPKQVIDKSQAYFWTEAWQEGEREAEADLTAGRVERFETLEELFADLDAEG